MDNKWFCTRCGRYNDGNFCSNCGNPKPAGIPAQAAPQRQAVSQQTAPQPAAVPQQQAAPVKKERSAGRNKKALVGIIIGAAALVTVAAVVAVLVLVLSKNYKVNKYVNDGSGNLYVRSGYFALLDDKNDISFIYPGYLTVSAEKDGDYIYAGERGEYPYVKIQRTEGKTSPEKYFNDFAKDLNEQYSGLRYSDIYEVDIEDKTLYMVRTHIPKTGADLEQYLEIYKDYYVTYTSMGYEAGEPNTELYYAIQSLRPDSGAYPESAVAKDMVYENVMGNYSVVVDPGYSVSEFSSGLFAQGSGLSLFAAYFNSDPQGAIIYDRADFLTRATVIDGYLAAILGVNSVEQFSAAEFTETEINGTSFRRYPISVVFDNGTYADGEMCIADTADTFGCYILCYYMEPGAGEKQASDAENFFRSMTINGEPNISSYLILDLTSQDLGHIALRVDLIGDLDIYDDMVVFYSPDKEETVTLEIVPNTTVYEMVSRESRSHMDMSGHLYKLNVSHQGRYEFIAYHLDYKDKQNNHRNYEVFGLETSGGNVIAINYDVNEINVEWAREVANDLIWSWKQY